MLKKNAFILSLFIYMVAFNILVLNAVSKNGILTNLVTGNTVGLNANPTTDPKFVLPLFAFNLAIIGLFILSYHNFNVLKLNPARHHKA